MRIFCGFQGAVNMLGFTCTAVLKIIKRNKGVKGKVSRRPQQTERSLTLTCSTAVCCLRIGQNFEKCPKRSAKCSLQLWRANSSGIKDDNLRRNLSLIDAIVQSVHYFDDRISCLEMQRFTVCGHDRELPAYQHAGIYHRMAV